MHILTGEAVRRVKVDNALPQCSLLALESLGVGFAGSQLGKEPRDQRRHRCIPLGGLYARSAVSLVIHSNSNIFHIITLSQEAGDVPQNSSLRPFKRIASLIGSCGAACPYTLCILWLKFAPRHLHIIVSLQVHPELGTIAEVQAQAERGVCSNASTIGNDVGDPVWRNPECLRELILRKAVFRQKFLLYHFARAYWNSATLAHGEPAGRIIRIASPENRTALGYSADQGQNVTLNTEIAWRFRKLDGQAFERLGRYETALWRQVYQVILSSMCCDDKISTAVGFSDRLQAIVFVH